MEGESGDGMNEISWWLRFRCRRRGQQIGSGSVRFLRIIRAYEEEKEE